jgi:hypothetical protein
MRDRDLIRAGWYWSRRRRLACSGPPCLLWSGSNHPDRGRHAGTAEVGLGLILALAVGSQVIASRLRIPALIILLPAGFIAAAITTRPDRDHL